MPHPHTVRLASLLPAAFSLSDYEPFQPLGSGTFGLSALTDVTATSYGDLKKTMQKAFAQGATCGFCPPETVRALFFDMDATVIAEESLVELAAYAGKQAEVHAITERAMAGELDFAAALRERVAMIAGLDASALNEVAEKLTLNRGIQPLAAFCREIGVKTYLVSGGFTALASVIQRKVGFDAIHANTLEVKNGKLTGGLASAIVDAVGKKTFVLETCAALGISPAEVAAIGDGANDIPMLQSVGVAIGFQAKPVVMPHVHAWNAAGNHAFLGPLLFGRDLGVTRRR